MSIIVTLDAQTLTEDSPEQNHFKQVLRKELVTLCMHSEMEDGLIEDTVEKKKKKELFQGLKRGMAAALRLSIGITQTCRAL